MRKLKSHFGKKSIPLAYALAGAALIALLAYLPRLGNTSPIPGLTAILSNDNSTLTLTVTNAVTNEYYQIYTVPALDPFGFTWSIMATGALGQSNFDLTIGPGFSGFFKAESGLDRDGDGFPNTTDANPNDTNNAAILSVTIESPAKGSSIP